jgi:hypothetical protein
MPQTLVEIVEKTLLMLVPSPVTTPTITTAINAAIMAYSIAVTPDSSLIKLENSVCKLTLLGKRNRSQKA